MESEGKDLFTGQKYLSLETYRKSGAGVRTPVWFAQEDGRLYVWTFGNSGKARRIRRSGEVKVAPCDRTGNVLGPFVPAEARIEPLGSATYQHGNQLLDQKYGLMKKMFGLLGGRNESQRVVIEIKLLNRDG